MANRIKKGDQVVVNAGKDKGKQGEVVRVDGDRVVVANVNIVNRHTKPNPQAGRTAHPADTPTATTGWQDKTGAA